MPPLSLPLSAVLPKVSRPLSLSNPQALPSLLQVTLASTARRAEKAAHGVSAITPTPQGASGRVYLVAIGEKGPRDVTRYGGYEDQYVKTSVGWRIKKRTHVRNKAWSNPLLQSADLN